MAEHAIARVSNWATTYAELSAQQTLGIDDLERLAESAYLLGHHVDSVDAWTRAHTEALHLQDVRRAVRCAFWLAFGMLNRGEFAGGGGWVDRGRRLLTGTDCVEGGYLDYCTALRQAFEGDVASALTGFRRATEVGEQFADQQLITLGMAGEGRCLLFTDDIATGLALLDQAMASMRAQEISPIAAGDTYCTAIDGCQDIFDLQRAEQWTTALNQWCDTQPGLVFYRGMCLVHRAELMHLHGAWAQAALESERACQRLADPPGQATVGAAHYLRAELSRLRGASNDAEAGYREAHALGHDPQPGLALLRLEQGQVAAARASVERALEVAEGLGTRARLLIAFGEILVASGDLNAARAAAAELAEVAAALGAPYLLAQSAVRLGAVLHAEGDSAAAALDVRRACALWHQLGAPYELARSQVLLAEVLLRLGDADGADWELTAARRTFTQLGATGDLARLGALPHDASGGVLSAREVEVLRAVATGKTNRAIAAELVISEKTVARHLSNIFLKLGVSSRAGATAYAFQHGLAG